MTEPKTTDLTSFIIGSNAIEGIWRNPSESEVMALDGFIKEKELTVGNVTALCQVFQPDAKLRDKENMNVIVGDYVPPRGGPSIPQLLANLLSDINQGNVTAFEGHLELESIHPFTDGNGRTGRAVWLWQMTNEGRRVNLPFLHHFYYSTLQEWRHDTQKAETSARIFTTQPD